MTTVFVTHDQEEALEVADEIVVINDGRIEQVGTPDELYDEPANDFVMSFLGEVTRLDGVLIRPHDIDILSAPPAVTDGAVPGTVTRMLRVGFEVRVTVRSDVGDDVAVVLSRAEARGSGLTEGASVWLAPHRGAQTVAARRAAGVPA